MNENKKTLTFVAVAAVVVLVALLSIPSTTTIKDEFQGKLLFPEFTDPLAVTSLAITDYDEDTATLQKFEVQQSDVKGKAVWTIPSHDSYPADAKEHLASAASGMVGLKILDVASENQGDQKVYGVVEPNAKDLKVGSTGVGSKVVMRDKEGKDVLGLVIGKEVPDRPGQRYVRKLGQDPIYVVEVKTDKLSTKFENWIERNLLQISSYDIRQVWIRDYSIKLSMEGLAQLQKGDFKLAHNEGEPKWAMLADRRFVRDEDNPNGGRWVTVSLKPDEELNTAKLDEMLAAFDDLKIVDVSRKPTALSADLKKEKGLAKQGDATVQELASKGFFLIEGDVYSNEGEMRLTAADGCEYVLRFGDIAGAGTTNKEDKAKTKDGKNAKDKKTEAGLNRYLFIMAEFNTDMIPKPKLEPLPEIKVSADAKTVSKTDAPKADAKKPDGKVAETKPADAKPADTKPDVAKKAGDQKAEAKKPEDAKSDAAKAQSDAKATEADATKKALEAERARIERDNQRKQDEYDQKVADGKKRVAELNARFADWYYIISEDVYRKIHLGRDEIIKLKDQPKGKAAHAGHEHGAEPADEPTTPMEELERLKQAGPGGVKK